MRNIVILLLPAFFLALFASGTCPEAIAADAATPIITVRAAKHADFFRIVINADDTLIQKATVSARENKSFRVDFPGKILVELGRKDANGNPIKIDAAAKKATDLLKGILIQSRPSGITLTIEQLTETKVSRLANPARLVIDAAIEKKSQEKPIAPVTEKPDIQIQAGTVMIDPGHGGSDKGIHSATTSEKDIALGVGRDLAATIQKSGKKAILTRKGDQQLLLGDRVAMASALKGVPFLSIHTSLKKEIVVYHSALSRDNPYREKAEALAQRIADHLGRELQMPAHINRLPGLFLAGIPAPAVLIELPSPVETPYDKKMRERILRGLMKGLASIKENGPSAPVTSLQEEHPPKTQRPAQIQPKKKVVDEI